MGTETLAELQKAAQQIRDGLKNVNEDIKKLTGRDPSDVSRPVSRRVQLKRNSFNSNSRQTEPQAKHKRDSNITGVRRWGRTLDSGGRTSIDDSRLESSGEEDESSKPTIQSVIATELKPARSQTQDAEEDTKIRSRNRRMFGFLVGTLQKFKDETKQKTEGEKRREEIEKKLEEKAEEERKEVFTQKKELFQSRREKQQELRTLERKMDNAVLKEQILAHNTHLEHFILLKSMPPIFYLPVRHNEETAKRLEESKEALKDLQESRFNAIDEVDESFLVTIVNKGLDKGKNSNQPVGVGVRDVGHRNLFDNDKGHDLDGEGDVMMDESKRENIEMGETEGDKDTAEIANDDRQLKCETNENQGDEVESALGSNLKNVVSDEKDREEKNERENEGKAGDESMGMQVEEEEKYESHQEEQDKNVSVSEKSETRNDETYSKSLHEESHQHIDVSGLTESQNENGVTSGEKLDFQTDDVMRQGICNEDADV